MSDWPKRSSAWDRAEELEDVQAILAGIENLRAQIEHKALFEQGYDEIFDLAVKMIPELRRLKLQLKRVRDIAVELAREGKKE